MGLFRFSKVSQVPGVDCQNLLSLKKGGIPCEWNGVIRGVGLFWNGAMGGVTLFGPNPEFLLLGRIGIMGKVDMGGGGSSTMEMIGVTLLRVLRVPFIQNGQESLLFQVDGFLSPWGWLTWWPVNLQ